VPELFEGQVRLTINVRAERENNLAVDIGGRPAPAMRRGL
jgi:hypothetical protein